MTEAEVSEMHRENVMMKEAILFLLNPEMGKASWDIPFTDETQVREFCRSLYRGNWSQDFVNMVFGAQKN